MEDLVAVTQLIIDSEKCIECERCSLICSYAKTSSFKISSARVHIRKQWPYPPAIGVCREQECKGTPCVYECPTETIVKYDDTGIVEIISDDCIGCGKCVTVCPYNAIHMENEIAYKCDLCGGSPRCVPECPTGALAN